MTRKVASAVSVLAVMFGGAACTKEVSGVATAANVPTASSDSTSGDEPTSEDDSTSEDEPTTSGNDGASGAAQAPDEPFLYGSGTSVKLDAPVVDDSIDGLLSTETGRILNFHIDNQSELALDLTMTALDANVECNGKSQWVFFDEGVGGPENLAAGALGDYVLKVAIKKDQVGETCLVELPFEVEDPSIEVDTATFEIVMD